MKLKRLIVPVIAALLCLSGLFLCIIGPNILLNMQEQSVLNRVSADDGIYYKSKVDAYTGEIDMYQKLLMLNGKWKSKTEVTSISDEEFNTLSYWNEHYWIYGYEEVESAVKAGIVSPNNSPFFANLAAVYAENNKIIEYDTDYNDFAFRYLYELFNEIKEVFYHFNQMGFMPMYERDRSGISQDIHWYPQIILLYQYTDSVFGKYQFDVIELQMYQPEYRMNMTVKLDTASSQMIFLDVSYDDEEMYKKFCEEVSDGFEYTGDNSPITTYSEEYSEMLREAVSDSLIVQRGEFASGDLSSIRDYSELDLAGVQWENKEFNHYCFKLRQGSDEPVYLIIEYRTDGAKLFFTAEN